jgi:hypothetical protein
MRQEAKPTNQAKRLIWREVLEEAKAAHTGGVDAAEIDQVFAPINAISKNPLLRPVVLGPMGEIPFEELKSVDDGMIRLKSVAYEFTVAASLLSIWRMGYASWNTCIIVGFKQTPDIWIEQYPHSNWVFITSDQHAFYRWGLIKPSGLLHVVDQFYATRIFQEMVSKVDGYRSDGF